MELTREDHLEPAKRHLTYRGDYAPVEVFGAMLSLVSPAEVTASVVASEPGEGKTAWRAAWLSEDRLTYCEASSDRAHWSLDLGQAVGTVDAQVEAWSVRLSDVASIGIVATRAGRAALGVYADAVWSVECGGDRSFTVPLFGDIAHHNDVEGCEAFTRTLRAAL